jgi:hypothetical protein
MRIQPGDSVILRQEPSTVGIIERRQGDTLTIRFPDRDNRREQVSRREMRALAEVIYEARKGGTRYGKTLSLTGGSTLADLVLTFWEGIISWAFHAAQRFSSYTADDRLSPQVFIGPPAVLQTYLEASVLHAESPRLQDGPFPLT